MPRQCKEIKVLFVTHYRELYGANQSLLQLILELREKGVVATVIMPDYEVKPGNDLGLELERLRIRSMDAKIRFDKHPDWKKAIPSYFRTLLFRKSAAKAIRGMDFDLVHSNSSIITTGAYLARKLGKPHIWHLREFGDLDYGMLTPFGKWYQRILYGGSNHFIAISESIKQHYARWTGSQDMRVIYNGIKPSPKRKPGKRKRVEICIVGLIHENKGQFELVKAIDELVNKRGVRDLHATLVGSGNNDHAAVIERYIRDNGLSAYVTMTGRRNDVPDLLTKMDIGVMASRHEAFGRTTVEYLMAGLAVVASDGGANKEIVEDGKTGLIYRSADYLSLADTLQKLVEDRDALENLATNGQLYAESKFTSRANSDAVYELYNEILKRK